MHARPAIAPDNEPRSVGLPVLILSISIQVSIPIAAAELVTIIADTAKLVAPNADPALNPNHPNHRRPVPSMEYPKWW